MFTGMNEMFSGTKNGEFWGPWAHSGVENKINSRFEVGCPHSLSPNFSLPPLSALRPSTICFEAFFRAYLAELKFNQAVGKTFVSEEINLCEMEFSLQPKEGRCCCPGEP